MDPYLLHDPVILGALLLGLSFLLLRLGQSLAAQLLAGTLLLVTAVCYVPPIATFFGDNIVVPGQLWRLAWPLPLAAVLTVFWMGWKATLRARKGLNRLRIPRRITAFLPLVLLGAMIALAAPASVAAVEDVRLAGGPPYGVPTCFAPVRLHPRLLGGGERSECEGLSSPQLPRSPGAPRRQEDQGAPTRARPAEVLLGSNSGGEVAGSQALST